METISIIVTSVRMPLLIALTIYPKGMTSIKPKILNNLSLKISKSLKLINRNKLYNEIFKITL